MFTTKLKGEMPTTIFFDKLLVRRTGRENAAGYFNELNI